jgi:exoribonuclease R
MTLSRLGMARREQRFNSGVFKVDSVKKKFKLNDKLWPIDYVLEDRKEANFIVEEFMLLAN